MDNSEKTQKRHMVSVDSVLGSIFIVSIAQFFHEITASRSTSLVEAVTFAVTFLIVLYVFNIAESGREDRLKKQEKKKPFHKKMYFQVCTCGRCPIHDSQPEGTTTTAEI